MRVRVLYFAVVRDLVGKESEEVALPDDVNTIAAFSAWLERTNDALRGRLGSVRIAKNEAFATSNDSIAEGDVLALIPPVAGG